MAAPSTVPAWNTGGANRTAPSGGEVVTGYTLSAPVSSSKLNYLLFWITQWCSYLANITAEALVWTVAQTFNRGVIVSNSLSAGNNAGDFTSYGNGAAVRAQANGSGSAVTGTSGTVAGTPAAVFTNTHATNGKAVRAVSNNIGLEAEVTTTNGLALNLISGVGSLINAVATKAAGFASVFTNTGQAGVAQFNSSGSGSTVQINNTTGGTGKALEVGSSATATSPALTVLTAAQSITAATFTGASNAVDPTFTTSGRGADMQGGSPYGTGQGAAGGRAIGGRAAPGLESFGGTGITPGLLATGGQGGGAGGKFLRGDSNNTNPAIELLGSIDMTGAALPASNIALLKQITRGLVPRAVAIITLNGTNSPTINWGQNIASVSQATTGELVITWAAPFASGVTSFVEGRSRRTITVSANPYFIMTDQVVSNTGTSTLDLRLVGNSALSGTIVNQANSNGATIILYAFGDQ